MVLSDTGLIKEALPYVSVAKCDIDVRLLEEIDTIH